MNPPDRRIRLLALDVDGTLLDGRGELRPRTASAIARAAEAGIRPVLCTGRRYRRALPVARDARAGRPARLQLRGARQGVRRRPHALAGRLRRRR